jgi:hypothetical protein
VITATEVGHDVDTQGKQERTASNISIITVFVKDNS